MIIGSGSEEQELRALAEGLGIGSLVSFTGRMERDKAWEMLASGDIFLYPSLRDAVTTVVLEAMAAGLPVICLDGSGPAQAVSPETGIIVERQNIKQVVSDLAEAMKQLITDADLRQGMGRRAQKKVAVQYTWKAQAREMLKVYAEIGVPFALHD